MSGARLLRRYVAWSFDAAIIALAAWLACHGRVEAGLARVATQFDLVATTMARNVLDLIDRGGGPGQLYGVLIHDASMHAAVTGLTAAVFATLWPPMIAFALIGLAYYTVFEASPWQATPGKRLLGLRTTARDGDKLGIVRAALRQLAGLLSWLTLNIGHAWAAKPPQHRALHDHVAGARVTQRDGAGSLPWWAMLWLLLQFVTLFVALACLYRVANAATSRAFDALL